MSKKLRSVAIVLLLAISLWAFWQLLLMDEADQSAQDAYSALEQFAPLPTEPPAQATLPADTTPALPVESLPPVTEVPSPTTPPVDFSSLWEINPDIVAWITIEGTSVHYPVVQGADNEFYINHLFDGSRNRAGAIFLDYRNSADLSDPHSIIYGHHLINDTMFSALEGYKEQGFYDIHPTARIITPERVYTLHFFAGYVADTSEDAWRLDLSGEEMAQWLDAAIRRSWFRADRYPASGDRIVTLSTCSYEYEDARFVLLGFLE